MASLNHHPYLSEVLHSLSVHQQLVEGAAKANAAAPGATGAAEHQPLFEELPWKNDPHEWADIAAEGVAARAQAAASASVAAAALAAAKPPAVKQVVATFWSRVTPSLPFRVDGEDRPWEDDTRQMKKALRLAGEAYEDYGDEFEEEGGTYDEEPADTAPIDPSKAHRESCKMFSF